jgi:cyclic beta-1,2-glucan synthetase
VLHARNGKLIDQIARAEEVAATSEPSEVEARAAAERPRRRALAAPVKRGEGAATLAPVPDDLAFWNGYGGFAEDGRSYVVRLKGGEATPHPWINVMANGSFGFHVSAEGAGFTWSRKPMTPSSRRPGSCCMRATAS